uniref:Uncharacterized protein n=1 Tax=Phytophthora ramorum TaxID=164328 RepID=H3GDF1_PHYRM
MVSTTSILAMVAAAATTIDYVQAHGYIANPAPTWKKEETNDWVVEIAPLWKGGWDESKGDDGILAVFKELSATNNYKDLKTLMDGPEFGEDCGFTDPNGTPSDPPTDGTATFSRGIVHAGPCEIWLDDKMVLQNDDCQSAYGDGTQETISVFKPVDYSGCAAGGCLLRFYWLALQRLDGKAVWQSYKNCIPLTGPAGGGASQTAPSTGDGSNVSQTQPSSGESDTPSTGDASQKSDTPSTGDSSKKSDSPSTDSSKKSDTPSSEDQNSPSSGDSNSPSSGDSNSPSTETTPAPESPTTWTQAPSADTPEMTPAPSSKCNGRRRRRD